jgi:hypothetical protein
MSYILRRVLFPTTLKTFSGFRHTESEIHGKWTQKAEEDDGDKVMLRLIALALKHKELSKRTNDVKQVILFIRPAVVKNNR